MILTVKLVTLLHAASGYLDICYSLSSVKSALWNTFYVGMVYDLGVLFQSFAPANFVKLGVPKMNCLRQFHEADTIFIPHFNGSSRTHISWVELWLM